MPPGEARALRSAYEGAETILEYGSGGSTVLAGTLPGKHVFSVESDAGWFAQMQGWFAANPPQAVLALHHADVGPTKEWGHPADKGSLKRWPGYPVSVWDRADFRHPDVVLIDGRFRVACLLTTIFRITRPVVALFDDYRGRKVYHGAETMVRPVEMIGRMARFELQPTAFPVDRMAWVIGQFMRPV